MLKLVNLLFVELILKLLILMELLKLLHLMNRNQKFQDRFLHLLRHGIGEVLLQEIWGVFKKEWKLFILYGSLITLADDLGGLCRV